MTDDRDICERLEDPNYDGALYLRINAAKEITALRYRVARLEGELASEQYQHAKTKVMLEKAQKYSSKQALDIVTLGQEVGRLREALMANMAVIREAQDVLCRQLIAPPRGLSNDAALNALHRVLDGPEQRAALSQARAALAEQGPK